MNNHVQHLFKRYFCRSQFFIMRLALVCSILLVVYVYLYSGDVDKIVGQKDSNQQKQDTNQQKVTNMNATHINGFLMEPVHANYTRNIYFTIKTTHRYYAYRLFPIMLTWLQSVDKNKLSIITDRSASKQNYVDMFRRVGYNMKINDECNDTHSRESLVYKMGTEFATYYKTIDEHPGEEDRYQWFCHSDDDVYVNVPKLSHLLQQYDPHKPHYIGKWPPERFWGKHITVNNETLNHFSHDMHLPLKWRTFQYATGSTFCISYALMMEAKTFLNGPKSFYNMSVSSTPNLHDDVLVGFILGALLGHNLIDTVDMTNQYDDYITNSTLKDLIRYITISRDKILTVHSLGQFTSSLNKLSSVDSTKFLLYHCLLYPTVSWCS